ncbi:hypothetical protein HK097_001706, partial [Rhizophlyctis rosea]
MEAQLVRHRKVTKKKQRKPVAAEEPVDEPITQNVVPEGQSTVGSQHQQTNAEVDVLQSDELVDTLNFDVLRPAIPQQAPSVYPSYPADSLVQTSTTEPTAPLSFDQLAEPSAPDFEAYPQYPEVQEYVSAPPLEAHAPSLYHDASAQNIAYPTAPELTHDDTAIAYPSAPPAVVTKTSQKSIPATLDRRQSVIGQLVLDDQIPPQPLEDAVLSALHPNTLLSEHTALVSDFRSTINNLDTTDSFYEHVLEYESAFHQTQKAKLRVQALQSEIHNIVTRIWTLKKETQKVEATCGDGVKLTHTFTSEAAVHDEGVTEVLKECLAKLRAQIYKELVGSQFQAKLAKLWIQNYLDEFLYQMPLLSQQRQPAEPPSPLNAPSLSFRQAYLSLGTEESDVERLKHCINVLFYFEKKSKASRTYSSDLSTGLESTNINASPFFRDIRGWISHLTSALLKVATLYDHRFILLHVLRCEGIGPWGASFVQWHPPSTWSNEWMDHYLTSLHATLGPIEELEEVWREKEAEIGHVKERLRREEENDWVVVVEEDVGVEPLTRSLTFLGEEDYLAILEQFNVVEMFRYLLLEQNSVQTEESYPSTHSGGTDAQLLRLFSISHQVLGTLARGLTTFPDTGFNRLKKKIGQIMVTCTNMLIESMTANLSRWTYESYHSSNHLLHRPVLIGGRAGTTMAAEVDNFALKCVQALVGTTGCGLWGLLVRLPIERISLATKWMILEG